MATNVVLNGVSYSIPSPGDTAWGQDLTDYFIAQASGLLQKAGGSFSLTAEVDFGATYGLKSVYFKSRAASPATTGPIRLGNAELIAWRNAANNANLGLTVNSSNLLEFDGTTIQPAGAYITALTGHVVATGPGSVVATIQPGVIVNSMISASALIAYSKMAAMTAGSVLLGNASNIPTVTALSGNVTIDSSGVTTIGAGAITNSMVNASAAIALSKLAALTVGRALVSDGSGFVSVATTTSTEIGFVNGVTSAIQTQLDAKTLKSTLTTKGDIYAASGASTPVRVAVGSDGTVLTADAASTAGVKWTSPLVNPMTTGGDMIYGGVSGAATRLANGSVGDVLTSAGGTNAPAWISRALYSGYLTAGTDWTTASTTFADFGSGATISLTSLISVGFGSPAAAGSSLPGVTVTLPMTAYYEVTATFNFFESAAADATFQLVDGSGTVIAKGPSIRAVGNYQAATLVGLYSGTAGAATFKLQGATSANTLHLSNGAVAGTPAISFTVKLVR